MEQKKYIVIEVETDIMTDFDTLEEARELVKWLRHEKFIEAKIYKRLGK